VAAASDAVGALFVVSTPIGNLKDITLRALEVLGSVDLIAAEDTRRTRILLTEFGITKPVTSYHDYTEARKARSLIAQMAKGKRVALVSEAGSPGISDPCYRLVRAALESGTPVIPVPGVTALVPALVVSGLPVDRFAFEGFLPARSAARRKRLAGLRNEPRTMIFYEAPHRLVHFLADLEKELGNRDLAVARELTKVHEEVVRGSAGRLAELFRKNEPRGEFVVVCEGTRGAEGENPEMAALADRHLEWLLKEKKVSTREAAREVAHVTRMPRNALYRRAVALAKGGKTRSTRS
jgi:16S rRNA (cytidine1402-2'-O)-methyltransferase